MHDDAVLTQAVSEATEADSGSLAEVESELMGNSEADLEAWSSAESESDSESELSSDSESEDIDNLAQISAETGADTEALAEAIKKGKRPQKGRKPPAKKQNPKAKKIPKKKVKAPKKKAATKKVTKKAMKKNVGKKPIKKPINKMVKGKRMCAVKCKAPSPKIARQAALKKRLGALRAQRAKRIREAQLRKKKLDLSRKKAAQKRKQ